MVRFSNIPSLASAKTQLLSLSSLNRVPNSLLFTGADGGASFYLALQLAQHMVCEKPKADGPCNNCTTCKQFSTFNYPDLHLSFPFNKTGTSGNESNCLALRSQLANELMKNPFITHERWLGVLNMANKQAAISVGEAKSITHVLSLKSFSSKPRVVILWQPELLNQSAANKLLKLIEEPGDNVHFFLISHRPEAVLKTILSRCIALKVPPLTDEDIFTHLTSTQANQSHLASVVLRSNGSLGVAYDALNNLEDSEKTYANLVLWLRAIYTNRPSALIFACDTLSSMYREDLKVFLDYTSSIFRQSLLYNNHTGNGETFKHADFSLERFAPFIATNKSAEILAIIEDCRRDISRNANAKTTLLDASLQLTKYIGKA